jgi:hypothetical protein
VLSLLSLAACNRGLKSDDALRQAVLDHLAKGNFNVAAMDVRLTKVDRQGSQADVTASIAPKGGDPATGMTMGYHLEQQGNGWVVVGRQNSGGSPHGGMTAPDAANPHGAGMAAPDTPNPHGGGSAAPPGGNPKMPSPEDLPPAGKKQ